VTKSIHLYPPRIHLENGKKPKEDSDVSTVSTFPLLKGPEEVKGVKGTTIGIEVDTVDTVDAEIIPGITPGTRSVAYNDRGWRVGEGHPKARLTDAQIEQIRDEYEAGGVGYRRLSARWGISRRSVRDIVHFNRRNQWAARWK